MIIRRTVLLLMLVALGGCAKIAAHGCPGSGPAKQISLIYNPALIFAAPEIKTVQPGDIIRFKLVGTPGVMVLVAGKVFKSQWVNGGGNDKEFYVCVPGDQADDDYYYRVEAYGSPTLDPMVRIL